MPTVTDQDTAEAELTARMFVPPVVEACTKVTPLGRLGTVEGVVGPFAGWFCDEATFMTGQNLVLDGGRSMVRLLRYR